MSKLSEEIAGRVEEIGRIMARVMGKKPALPVREFTLAQPTAADDHDYWEVTFADGSKSCYDNVNQMTCAGPCPCA